MKMNSYAIATESSFLYFLQIKLTTRNLFLVVISFIRKNLRNFFYRQNSKLRLICNQYVNKFIFNIPTYNLFIMVPG